jgi:hypothetical protein
MSSFANPKSAVKEREITLSSDKDRLFRFKRKKIKTDSVIQHLYILSASYRV